MPLRQKLAALALATAGLAASLPASAPALGDEAPPVAVAARLADDDGGARLIFDLSAPVDARRAPSSIPTASSSTSPRSIFRSIRRSGAPGRGGRSARSSNPSVSACSGPGKSRIVIDLNGPARVASVWRRSPSSRVRRRRGCRSSSALRAGGFHRRGDARRARAAGARLRRRPRKGWRPRPISR